MILFRQGTSFIKSLIPHREPFLMVDRIIGYESGSSPAIICEKSILDSETVLDNSGNPHWPEVNIIEGLGQSSLLVSVVKWLDNYHRSENNGQNLFTEDKISANRDVFFQELQKKLEEVNINVIGLSASVEINILDRVPPGETLTFQSQENFVFNDKRHYNVKAFLGEKVIAEGTMIGAFPETEQSH
jgi:3-hydroxymyristoyl/3-hydroxydecanoyl-(acyl carrier protein) dehydratase